MTDIDKKIVFAIAPRKADLPAKVILGMPTGAWDAMDGGRTHDFDFTRGGLALQLMIFRGRDHDECVKTITDTARLSGTAVLDERNKSYAIELDPNNLFDLAIEAAACLADIVAGRRADRGLDPGLARRAAGIVDRIAVLKGKFDASRGT